jgi:hypothetical protein
MKQRMVTSIRSTISMGLKEPTLEKIPKIGVRKSNGLLFFTSMGCVTHVKGSSWMKNDHLPFTWSIWVLIYGLVTLEAINIQGYTGG